MIKIFVCVILFVTPLFAAGYVDNDRPASQNASPWVLLPYQQRLVAQLTDGQATIPAWLIAELLESIEQLDQAAVKTNEAVRVVTLHRANPAAVQQALSAITGNMVQSGTPAAQSTATGTPGTTTPQPGQQTTPDQRAAEFQRRMEFFRQRGGGDAGGRRGGGRGR